MEHPFALAGGLNLAGITLGLKAGECTLLENYECLPLGGYRRYDGYERFDGQPEPSRTTYTNLVFASGTGALTVGATVTGAASHATGRVIDIRISMSTLSAGNAVGKLIVNAVSGVFLKGEPVTVTGAQAGVLIETPAAGSLFDDDYDRDAVIAADAARAPIGPPPGSGAVLGVVEFQGKAHAFRNALDGLSACMWISSPTGWTLAKSGLAPNGQYEFEVQNFGGASATRYLYGVSGTHKGFEWTGTVWNDVTTGMAIDKPTHVKSYKNHLVYAFPGGSMQLSATGTPLVWAVRTGAAEITTGADITAFSLTAGGTLAVYCVRSTFIFSGSIADDFALTINAADSGALPRSARALPAQTFALDARGIMPLAATQAFGDFSSAAVSERVAPFLEARIGQFVDAQIVKAKSQYRLFFADGTVLVVTVRGTKIIGYSVFRFPVIASCVATGVDPDGKEMLLMGGADGMVYRLDVGMSFDGIAIEAPFRLASDSINGTQQIKQFQSFFLHVSTPRPIKLQVQADFDFELSQSDISQYVLSDVTFLSSVWNRGLWDVMLWDIGDERPGISQPTCAIDGAATSISIAIFHGGEIRPSFTIESAVISYRNRGVRRR